MSEPLQSLYAYCARCKFGIEINISKGSQVRSEYHAQRSDGIICYYCDHGKRRNVNTLLRDCRVLLASAKRIHDTQAISFYEHQIALCESLLEPEPPTPQERLF